MWAVIKASVVKEIGYGVVLHIDEFVDVSQHDIAQALRGMVRSAYGGDDAGVDYFYDLNEGIVCIGGEPGWWGSREPVHARLLETADLLDGKDFSFDYERAKSERDCYIFS